MPILAIVTAGPVADCIQALAMTDGHCADNLGANQGYETDAIAQQIEAAEIYVVIPACSNWPLLAAPADKLHPHRGIHRGAPWRLPEAR
jgi:hypothetical protein